MSENRFAKIAKASQSESFRKLNPQLFGMGSVGAPKLRQPGGALVPEVPAKPAGKRSLSPGHCLTVTLTAFIASRMDPDNLATALKPLQDSVADWLNLDDGDPRIRWEYGQVETRGAQGVEVHLTCPTLKSD